MPSGFHPAISPPFACSTPFNRAWAFISRWCTQARSKRSAASCDGQRMKYMIGNAGSGLALSISA